MPATASITQTPESQTAVRHDWKRSEIEALFALPFNDLLFQAAAIHRANFDPNAVQVSTLLSIKTGACPEDCKYCSQSGHYNTELEKEKLLEVARVVEEAKAARDKGASRFCMGAAWRSPRDRDMPFVLDMIRQVKGLGMETCMTLGMLDQGQAEALADAGLDYYNHNLDTSPEYYGKVITTRTYNDRLSTLANVRDAGMKVCCGGIVGMGEQRDDRVGLLQQLANLPHHPESVPINMLVKIEGTPLADVDDLDPFEFVRTVAVARILMPESYVRLSAGRQEMNDEAQALCFMAGANSIFYGERLLTTDNPEANHDQQLFKRLGIHPLDPRHEASDEAHEEAIKAQVAEQEAEEAGLFYNAMDKRSAKHVLDKDTGRPAATEH
ncbi:MAG: biotin synthase BioB [Alcanivoracaceae bacterium]|uniref:biotin synthase BioB n=1 Tax=Alcanivorax sp. MD8A TaxID=1177157 RepID=UPI000C4BAC57|nr:biotin synthase BioB [Alcanivorax sp. MD8A]MAX54948.1 biotin synthase BioB [Alcanivoracaceae bacterium]MCG8437462.1 biotin synthase BioB [Pseudomonadales bacterium]MEE2870529.1 biotin synthase BioB [Pseudomonadota bacterium]PNE03590.1 biotin synthase [Alcanivorax sp. MD8A]|tara:strand:+ start:505 stop:1653 length:1149 start_codon:yes stop_codon:yes gene_type:complete